MPKFVISELARLAKIEAKASIQLSHSELW